MKFLRGLLPQTIVGQITSLVVAVVLLSIGMTTIAFVYYFDQESGANPELVAAADAARVATIVRLAEADPSSPRLPQMMSAARWSGVSVSQVPMSQLKPAAEDGRARSPILRSVAVLLKDTWGIVPLAGLTVPDAGDALILKASDDSAIVLWDVSAKMLAEVAFLPALYAVVSVGLVLLFFSIYGVRWITSPLSQMAQAAHSFGQSLSENSIVTLKGPREITQVNEVLAETAKRIRALMDERTRMLAAISHDLRTPLTRMRLRAERIDDVKTRESMLDDISSVSEMLNSTLAYLREGGRAEPVRLVDLSSLAQTICGQFSDVGHSVAYEGPGRLPFACRAQALTRALTNIVENGVKNASAVTVRLKALDGGAAEIEVADDGPGIPAELLNKVFDPFFKVDAARTSSRFGGGFGLGLSIARDVVTNHGGEIVLSNRAPHGLAVRIELRPLRLESSPSAATSTRFLNNHA